MPNAFVDTHILVYAADETTPPTRITTIVREVLLLPVVRFSVQVLNQFVASSRRADKLSLPGERERRWLEGWLLRTVAPLSAQTSLSALSLHARFQISHWDSLMIVASALETGCETIYSENLNHGQDYGGTTVVNPFF